MPAELTTPHLDELPPAPAGPTDTPRFELHDVIGVGGMGVVYRARDVGLKRDVAVKVLKDGYPPAGAAARRFVAEAEITAQLQHPGIPPVYHVGRRPDGRPFLAMKLIKGETLAELLKGNAERGRLVAVFEGVCQAVAYAHAHGVIHRDLKPANVMVGAFGEVQVMDWGLAKVLTAVSREAESSEPSADPEATTAGTEIQSLREESDHTQDGQAMGTPAYMSPEQAIGSVAEVDRRSDVFGLGAVLCHLLTGRPPYQGSDAVSVRALAARAKLDDARARLHDCGAEPELVALCERCLAAEKADRPADAGAVAADVAALRAAADERARRAELDAVRAEGERAAAEVQAAEGRRRARLRLAVAGLGGLLLVVGLGFAWYTDRQATARRGEAEARDRDDRDRRARTAEAVAGLLDQAEAALRAGDASQAALVLEAARLRSAEGGAEDHAGRLGRRQFDLSLLRGLDDANTFRWTRTDGGSPPSKKDVTERFLAVLREHKLDPERDGSTESSDTIVASAVKQQAVDALDRVLFLSRSRQVRAALTRVDPNPFRDQVRDAVVAGDEKKVTACAMHPEAVDQPPGFVVLLSNADELPDVWRKSLLIRSYWQKQQDVGIMIELGENAFRSFRGGKLEEHRRTEMLRWYQAANTVRPNNPAIVESLHWLAPHTDMHSETILINNLVRIEPRNSTAQLNYGHLLITKQDTDGAIAAFREAIRWDTRGGNRESAHTTLARLLASKKDYDGAAAECRKLIEHDPGSIRGRTQLGEVLHGKGDWDGAAAAYRDALRFDAGANDARHGLGLALLAKGDADGAATAWREALRIDPGAATVRGDLLAALWRRGLTAHERGDGNGALRAWKEAFHYWLRIDRLNSSPEQAPPPWPAAPR